MVPQPTLREAHPWHPSHGARHAVAHLAKEQPTSCIIQGGPTLAPPSVRDARLLPCSPLPWLFPLCRLRCAVPHREGGSTASGRIPETTGRQRRPASDDRPLIVQPRRRRQ